MRSSTYVALLAGSAAAQSSVSIFNLVMPVETLTQIGADATATTYKNDCAATNAGISAIPERLRMSPPFIQALVMTDCFRSQAGQPLYSYHTQAHGHAQSSSKASSQFQRTQR